MQSTTIHTNPTSKIFITLFTLTMIALIGTVAIQLAQEVPGALAFIKQGLSNVASQTLYIR